MSIFFTYTFIWVVFFSLFRIPGQSFSETWIYISWEVIYIFYSHVFVLYLGFTENNHGCHQKDMFCLFFYVQIRLSQIFTLWTKMQSYHLTQSVLRTWVIFRFFSYVSIVHLLRIWEDVEICWNHLHPVFPWLSLITNGLKYYLLFRIPNSGSIFAPILQYMYTYNPNFVIF